MKELNSLLAILEKQHKFRIEHSTKHKYVIKIYAPDNKNHYLAHPSERAVHPIRRWAKNVCGVML